MVPACLRTHEKTRPYFYLGLLTLALVDEAEVLMVTKKWKNDTSQKVLGKWRYSSHYDQETKAKHGRGLIQIDSGKNQL